MDFAEQQKLTKQNKATTLQLKETHSTAWDSRNQDCQKYQQAQRVTDTTLRAEGKEESLTEGEDESEKAGLTLSIKKPKTMASGPIISWQIEGQKVEAVADFLFLGSKITANFTVTAVMKLDDWFLARKLWET